MQAVIALSLVSFALETLPDLTPRAAWFLYVLEVSSVVFFTVEYLVRILVAQSKGAYILSFFGLIDLIAILPFYLSPAVDLRFVRVVRMVRIVRLLKMARYNRAFSRLHRALSIAREELVLYGLVTVMLLFFAASGIYYCEHEAQPDVFKSVPHCFWWAVTTLTTVGYGDMYPVTIAGKCFTSIILMIGLGAVAAPAGIITSALMKAREADEDDTAGATEERSSDATRRGPSPSATNKHAGD